MHELAITQQLVELALNQLEQHHFTAAQTVTVEIGALSGVVASAVAFCYDSCTRGTALEGSQLHIVELAASGFCPQCGDEQELEVTTLACRRCGSFHITPRHGTELRLVEIDAV